MDKQTTKLIVAELDLDDVSSFGDLNGCSPELAIELHRRYGVQIDVLYVDDSGNFGSPAAADHETYLAELERAGVDPKSVRIVKSKRQLADLDVIVAENKNNSRPRMQKLEALFERSLHENSRLVVDIKKGSGVYPFLRQYGGVNTLIAPTSDTDGWAIMSVEPKDTLGDGWAKTAKELAGDDGFFTDCGEHSFVYIPRGKTLVVTFDNLDIAMTKRDDRRPWGYSFIKDQNWSMLGVMANGWTWFRDEAVVAEFDRLRDSGFFEQFSRVVFYGASMGGFAAAAYSAAAANSTVFVISPQSTLDKDVVPWETRYQKAWSRDYSGPYGDAAQSSQSARAVNLMFDPHVKLDARHAARFTGANVVHWRCPMMGHRLGSSLQQMGILHEIAKKSILGELDHLTFYKLLRKRHAFPRYQRELANAVLDRGHSGLALKVCNYVLRQRDDVFFAGMKERILTERA